MDPILILTTLVVILNLAGVYLAYKIGCRVGMNRGNDEGYRDGYKTGLDHGTERGRLAGTIQGIEIGQASFTLSDAARMMQKTQKRDPWKK